MPKVIDKLPNINSDHEVFFFVDYVCVEHYPYFHSKYVGSSFGAMCQFCDVYLPADCTHAHFRRDGYSTTLKEYGRYSYIINSKICFPQNEQNS